MMSRLTDAVVERVFGLPVIERSVEDLVVTLTLGGDVRVLVADLTPLGDPAETYEMLRATRAATGHATTVDVGGPEAFLAPGVLRGSAECTVLSEGVHTVTVAGGEDPREAVVALVRALS